MAKKEKVEIEERPYFYTGSDVIDLVVGGGKMGFPAGKIINIVGDKSAGKSFLCCEIIAAAKHKYKDSFVWAYDDAESGFSFNTEKLYGFEIMSEDIDKRFKSKTVEDMSCNVRKFLKSISPDQVGIYVLDSLDGLSSEELEDRADKRQKAFEKDEEFSEGSYQMASAKFLSQEFFRTCTDDIQDKNCLFIVVSQLRENVGAGLYAPKFKRAGGKAMDFYCHTVLWLTTLEKIEKKGRAIGVVINAETKKSKTARPFREGTCTVLFDYGIDNIGSNLDFLFDLRGKRGELLKSAKAIEWNEGMEPMTRDELITYIETNKLRKELRQRVIDKWDAIEAEIAVKRPGKYEDE